MSGAGQGVVVKQRDADDEDQGRCDRVDGDQSERCCQTKPDWSRKARVEADSGRQLTPFVEAVARFSLKSDRE